jgi:hypothetical protein
MTQIHPTTCPADMKASARNTRPVAPNRSRRHGIAVSYDGVTAAYIRDISTSLRPSPDNSR